MQRENIKVVFMGTPDFAEESLRELYEAGFNIIGVLTNPDKPSGRGMKLKASPVKEYALSKNIPVYQPKKVRNNEEILNTLKELATDVIAVVAYGKILPQEILDVPKYGSINVHGSLLPKYRGAAPMQWAIINGEETTGITTMFMGAGMDTGDMLLKAETKIEDTDNLETIHDRLKVMGAKLLVETIDRVVDGNIERIPQPEEGTMAPMISREMTKIDFNKNGREIFNFVRGLSPFPGTYMELEDGRKYKVFALDYIEDDTIDKTVEPGDIYILGKDELSIRCKDGYVRILTIQPENAKRMDIKAFLAGNRFNMLDKFI